STASDSSRPQFGTREDILVDDVDQFNAARDKILLDGQEYEYERDDDDDAFGDDQREVLGFDHDEGSDDSGDSEDTENEGEDDLEEDRYETMYIPEPSAIKPMNRRALRDEAHDDDTSFGDESDEEDLGWGANKRAYYSGNTAED